MQHLELRDYQAAALDFVNENPHSALRGAIGSGKSVVALSAIEEWLACAYISSALIVAPPVVINDTFPKEIERWDRFKNLTYSVLHGPHKEEKLRKKADIYLVSYHYDTLRWLFTNPACPKFGALILDECHNVKSQKAKRFKILDVVAPFIPLRLLMTGTLVGNTLIDLWAQYKILDGGYRLFRHKNAFERWWFVPGNNGKLYPKRGAKDELAKKVADITFDIDTSSVKLPELRKEVIKVCLPEDAMQFYRHLEDEAFAELGNGQKVTAFSARAHLEKCRQVANGFVYTKEDKNHNLANFIHNTKIDKAIELADAAEGGVMFVCNHREEIDRLRAAYPSAGVISGSTSTKNRRRFIDAWNAREIDRIIVHPQSGGEGVNIQHGGHTQIWCSMHWSSLRFKQTVGRLRRTGQPSDHVDLKIITAVGTIDELMLAAVTSHGKNEAQFLDLLKGYQDERSSLII